MQKKSVQEITIQLFDFLESSVYPSTICNPTE